jgi:hypothetical protein
MWPINSYSMTHFPKSMRKDTRLIKMHQDCYEATMRFARNRVQEFQKNQLGYCSKEKKIFSI